MTALLQRWDAVARVVDYQWARIVPMVKPWRRGKFSEQTAWNLMATNLRAFQPKGRAW